MTILVAEFVNREGRHFPGMMTDWVVIPNTDGKTCTVAQVILMSEMVPVQCTFDEFMQMAAEAKKVLDIRKLQRPPAEAQSTQDIIREILSK